MTSGGYTDLHRFITSDMRMSHVYQPVMLSLLLRNGGRATTEQIAAALLGRDRAQLDYYRAITQQMPGQVLRKRGIVDYAAGTYVLPSFEAMTPAERLQLVAACEAKIEAYLAARVDPWSHRRKSIGYVPGTMRYEVLKRAASRCELCGVSADFRGLEVDHIRPRNKGGGDEAENLQALCYSCNATKRDRDDTDFRGVRAMYEYREAGCPFCTASAERVVGENTLAFAILDAFPVTQGHTLIIPKRHLASGGELTQPEMNAVWALQRERRRTLQEADEDVSGFNFGLNDGAAAGQTVGHCHFHLIPRRKGDMEDPSGGVRGVIPERQKY